MELKDNFAKYIVVNGSMYDTGNAALPLPDGIGSGSGGEQGDSVIYEVIRFIDGKPLYLDDHYDRLVQSAAMTGQTGLISRQALIEYSQMLLKINGLENCNVKVMSFSGKDAAEPADFVLYNSKFFYPPDSAYLEGVTADCLEIERVMPNAKVRREEYLAAVDRFKNIAGKPLFEVLLLNRSGALTEGSKSNLFFVKNGTVVTAPDSAVLKGVMRKHVLLLCDALGVPVEYRAAGKEELPEMEAAFLTGTSIGVLPIGSIGAFSYPSSENAVVRKLMHALSEDMAADLAEE